MTDDLRALGVRLDEFSQTSHAVAETLERALSWIQDALSDLGALEGEAAGQSAVLARQAHDDLCNVIYGWMRDVDQGSQDLKRRLLD